MEMSVFSEMVCAAVRGELGKDYKVEAKRIRKNNGIFQEALLISCKGQTVIPNIYLGRFWEAYKSGIPFSVIVSRIVSIYRWDEPNDSMDIEFFRDYGAVRDGVCYRLIGRSENEDLLENIPHMEFLDMAICFYYLFHAKGLREGIIPIFNSHMEMWGVCREDLLRQAQANTPRLLPWECRALSEIVHETAEQAGYDIPPDQEDIARRIPMMVLRNQTKFHGAACILYPGVLEGIAAGVGNLYILPSSVHETILLKDDGRVCAGKLRQMVMEVNREQVAPEGVLTDSLYYYDSARKEILMA